MGNRREIITGDTNWGDDAYAQAVIEGLIPSTTRFSTVIKSATYERCIMDSSLEEEMFESRRNIATLFRSRKERMHVLKQWFGTKDGTQLEAQTRGRFERREPPRR